MSKPQKKPMKKIRASLATLSLVRTTTQTKVVLIGALLVLGAAAGINVLAAKVAPKPVKKPVPIVKQIPKKPGYAPPGYVKPGYTPVGYTKPGYTVPGYIKPGYEKPGYMRPPGSKPVIIPSIIPPKTSPIIPNTDYKKPGYL